LTGLHNRAKINVYIKLICFYVKIFINSGEKMKKVTLETIAQEIGVSKVAVFKALNGKGGVSEELKAKIQVVANNLGYTRTKKKFNDNMHFIYAINKNFFLTSSEQFYTSIYYYLTCECEKINSNLRIVFLDDQQDNISVLRNIASNSKDKIDGIFIAGEVSRGLIEGLESFVQPIVFIDFYSPLYNYSYIHTDNYYLSYMLTQHLIDCGHKNIGFVGNIGSTSAIADRYYGFKKALCENKLEYHPSWHINQNIEHLNDLTGLLPQTLPTAFVCHCDPAAHKMYAALNARNLTIPNDVSIISFDNTKLCDNILPTLTSAGCNKETIAKKSFSAMLEVLADKNKVINTILKPVFTIRNSVRDI
jgi:LacI family transcriptional regulator